MPGMIIRLGSRTRIWIDYEDKPGLKMCFDGAPRGSKRWALDRICEDKSWRYKDYFIYQTMISEREAFVIEGLSRKGAFASEWREVKDLEYDEFLRKLEAYFSARMLKES